MKVIRLELTEELHESLQQKAARYQSLGAWFSAAYEIYAHQEQLSDERAILIAHFQDGEERQIDYAIPAPSQGVRATVEAVKDAGESRIWPWWGPPAVVGGSLLALVVLVLAFARALGTF